MQAMEMFKMCNKELILNSDGAIANDVTATAIANNFDLVSIISIKFRLYKYI